MKLKVDISVPVDMQLDLALASALDTEQSRIAGEMIQSWWCRD
jgi:hypothetical protein